MITSATIIGTGNITPSIARAFAAAGTSVTIAGRTLEKAAAAAGDWAFAALIGPEAFESADLVLENIVEDLDTKRDVLARIEPWCSTDAVIATDTSSIPIGSIASCLARPGRFAGLHFLNPADQTKLVEVNRGPETSDETVETLRDYVLSLGKRPLVCNADVPGFIWNRLQLALVREALHLYATGVAGIEDIDAAVSDGLAPRWMATGPFATADMGGLDTWRRVTAILFPELSNADAAPVMPDDAFYEWTSAAREAVLALRAETLAVGRETSERREQVTPRPKP